MSDQKTFEFSTKSLLRLEECHEDLQRIMFEVIREMDITVLCGHRNEVDQNTAFINGRSKLRFPNSKHNQKPSVAIDVAPLPIDWNDIARFNEMLNLIERTAKRLNIAIRLGRTFSFKDYPHVELVFGKDKNNLG